MESKLGSVAEVGVSALQPVELPELVLLEDKLDTEMMEWGLFAV